MEGLSSIEFIRTDSTDSVIYYHQDINFDNYQKYYDRTPFRVENWEKISKYKYIYHIPRRFCHRGRPPGPDGRVGGRGLRNPDKLIGHATRLNHNTIVYRYRSCTHVSLYCVPAHYTHSVIQCYTVTRVKHSTIVCRYRSCTHIIHCIVYRHTIQILLYSVGVIQ